ncbi:prolyl oligopeptidase family serine peptidase [Luteimonas sp. RD2P54]|uniref:Prolyl oligopeptidase family serine peptidase n=1 Tax=Luteimonas endophytica TaxID=3042023 RepID=A0ABT6JAU0_9GAMM|nr:prolyl oligopeptidase family serine peptidase [Luteimonas endophytica]MDH5823717.1 prolyl oligopeptidase family serine peptidase [Luteimonas endophytica]
MRIPRPIPILSLLLAAGACFAGGGGPQPCPASRADGPETAIVEVSLAGVPAILRVPAAVELAPVLLWHGFGPPRSERELMALLPLDDVPAVKVYLGLPLHGARAPAAGELARRQAEDLASGVFEPVVMAGARELPAVVAALRAAGCARPGAAVGLFGFSAGGAAVFHALAERDVAVSAAVVLNASTGLGASVDAWERATGGSYAWNDRARALAARSDVVSRAADIAAGDPPPALLIAHGAEDAMVAGGHPQAAETALRPYYRGPHATRLQLQVVEGMAHAPAGSAALGALQAEVAAWFSRHLGPAGS